MAKVMIDPGHAPGNANKGPTGYYEYEGMWKLSCYLQNALIRCGIKAEVTRSEMTDPSLTVRGKLASGYDIFISQHSNAANGQARGAECYYSVKRPNDEKLASLLSKSVANVMNTSDRGAKTRQGNYGDYYTVMNAAESVGCDHVFLMENGFHDNIQDEAFLKIDSNLSKIAEAECEIFCQMLGVPYVQPNQTQDVHWAETYFNELNSLGVTVTEKRFDDPITRGEMMALLCRLINRM